MEQLTFDVRKLLDNPDDALRLFGEYGVVVVENIFDDDEQIVAQYLSDIESAAELQLRKNALDDTGSLDSKLIRLDQNNRSALGALIDLGSKPNKFLSGLRLKSHSALLDVVRTLLGQDCFIGTPPLSDRFKIVTPSEIEKKWALDVHQDYPYVLQSQATVTATISLSRKTPGIGGVGIAPKTHNLGIMPVKNNYSVDKDYFENFIEGNYEFFDFEGGVGEVVFFNSLVAHWSILNTTNDEARITQIFRYTDLACNEAMECDWAGAQPEKKGLRFSDLHPEKLVDSPAK